MCSDIRVKINNETLNCFTLYIIIKKKQRMFVYKIFFITLS